MIKHGFVQFQMYSTDVQLKPTGLRLAIKGIFLLFLKQKTRDIWLLNVFKYLLCRLHILYALVGLKSLLLLTSDLSVTLRAPVGYLLLWPQISTTNRHTPSFAKYTRRFHIGPEYAIWLLAALMKDITQPITAVEALRLGVLWVSLHASHRSRQISKHVCLTVYWEKHIHIKLLVVDSLATKVRQLTTADEAPPQWG